MRISGAEARTGLRLRLAGMAEFAGGGTQVVHKQIESLKATTQTHFPL